MSSGAFARISAPLVENGLTSTIVEGIAQQPTDVVEGGRRRVTWSARDLPALEYPEPGLPSDVHYWPRMVFRVGDQAWRDVARSYSDFVDEALKGFKPPAPAQAILGARASREQKIEALLEWVHDRVRYTGLELGMASVIPTAPATVLGRGYGDCKDKATLLVGLLRAAGIEAHVALLRAGTGSDITTAVPGVSGFNHVIVYVPGSQPLWLDATSTYSRIDQLPAMDRGRMALIAARGSQAPVMTPQARAEDNRYTETRIVKLADFGKGSVREEVSATGELEMQLRGSMDESRKALEEGFEQYVKREYGGGELKSFEVTPSVDVATPYHFVIDIDKAASVVTELSSATFDIDWSSLWSQLPAGILADEQDKPRQYPLAVPKPFDARLVYRVELPAGFEPILPEVAAVDMSPVLLERKVSREGDDVVVDLRLKVDGPRMSPEQVNRFREAVKVIDKEPGLRVVAIHKAALAYDKKDVAGALAIVAREASGGKAVGHLRHADVLNTLHLQSEALAEVRGVIARDPGDAFAHALLGDMLRLDRFGRLHGAGWDRKGAIEAALKAVELDEQYKKSRVTAANDAESGDTGIALGAGADLPRAAELWAKVEPETLAEFPDESLANNELYVLWNLERYDAIEAVMARRGNAAPRLGKLMLAWRRSGVPGVIEEMRRDSSKTAAEQARDLGWIYRALLVRESYANMGTLAESAGSLGIVDDPAIKLLQTTARTAEKAPAVAAGLTGPRRLFVDLLDASMLADRSASEKAIDRLLAARVSDRELVRDSLGWSSKLARSSTATVYRFSRDLLMGGTTLTSEGSDALGHRLTWTMTMGQMTDQPLHLYAVREGKEYRLRATSSSRSELAREALSRISAGDVEAGRKWLGWYFDRLHPTDDHPLAQSPDVLLWAEGKGDPRLVATLALALFDDAEAFKAIVAARAKLKDGEATALLLDQAIARVAKKADLAHARRAVAALRSKYPDAQALAFIEVHQAATAEDWKQVDRLVAAHLARYPQSYGMQRRHAHLLASHREYTRAIATLVDLQAKGVAGDEDFNNMAWWSLFLDGEPSEQVLDWAVRAASTSSAARIHTLGCVYAAMGRTRQALETFDRLIGMTGEPDLEDEFLLAEIHHRLGFKTRAREVYARLARQNEQDLDSTAELARRRLKKPAKP